MMGQLLRSAPVKILEVGSSNPLGRFHLRSLKFRFELDVESEIVFRAKIRQRFRILFWEWFSKRLESLHGDNPGRNAGAEIFGQKRTERLIFPSLHVAGAPIVHQDKTENVISRAVDWNGLA